MDEHKIFKQMKRLTGQAIGDFGLIEDNDRILVALSGGKDSWAMLYILSEICRRAPIHYELIPVTIDPGFDGFDTGSILNHLEQQGLTGHIEKTCNKERIDRHLKSGTSYCAFCARLRRGALYATATKLGCNKIALGHHLDDHIETLLLNQFYSGTIAAMSPKLKADNGIHTVIRPLVYVEEPLIAQWAQIKQIPQIDCSCPQLARRDQKRQKIKAMITELHQDNPLLKKSLLKAMANVQPRHLLDRRITLTND